MGLKTIKSVGEVKWAEFKGLAVKNRIPMGRLLENMLDAYPKHNEEVWDRILRGEKNLSDKEAEEMRKLASELRKEKWGRE